MSHTVIGVVAFAAVLLAPVALLGATETDGVSAGGICRWIGDPEAPSTSSIEAALAGAEQTVCNEAFACLLQAREKTPPTPSNGGDTTATGEADAGSVETICRELEEVLAMPRTRLEALSAELEEAPEGCSEFLGCLLGLEQTSWKDEFELICSKVPNGPNLTEPELQSLLRRCSGLQKRIEGLDLPEAKVYLFRLEKCRSFFEYAIELQQVWREERRGPAAG